MESTIYLNDCKIEVLEYNNVFDNIEVIECNKPIPVGIDTFEIEFEAKPVDFNYKLFRKWFKGSRKHKKKNFGLLKDKKRILKRAKQTHKLSVADFKRLL